MADTPQQLNDKDYGNINLADPNGENNSLVPEAYRKNQASKLFDVVNDYMWSNIDKNSDNIPRKQCPTIMLTEYQPNLSGMLQSLDYWFGQVNPVLKNIAEAEEGGFIKKTLEQFTGSRNPYRSLYSAIKTGTVYRLPFFDQYNHNVTNSWGENKGITEMFSNIVIPVAKTIVPSAGIESAKAWEGTNTQSYSFKFYLFNTFNAGEIEKNKNLIERLTYSCLQNRINFVASEPPSIFEVDIPGVRWSPAAYISNLNITNEGQINNMAIGKNKELNVPDAYGIEMQITELIVESKQIFVASIDKNARSKIQAIVEAPQGSTTEDQLNKTLKGAKELFTNSLKAGKRAAQAAGIPVPEFEG